GQTTYPQLDNASLLGLLPLLNDRIEQGKRQLEAVTSSIARSEKFNKQCEKWLDQAVGLQEQGHDVSEPIEQFERSLHAHAETAPKEHQFQRGLFTYLIDLESRRKWIVEVEALRRG